LPWLAKSAVPSGILVEGQPAFATDVRIAFDSASRNKGLLGRTGMKPSEALVIAPCQAIHTFAMKFPIDVVFAARDGRVLKTREAIPPRRLAASLRAFAVIEMAAGEIARAGIRKGDRLVVQTAHA
jgi:hypothetical protein